jgi:hypothetical protein
MSFTSKVFLVRPSSFGYDPQTAASNAFQKPSSEEPDVVSARALEEFERVAEGLAGNEIEVVVADDSPQLSTPDAVFPNNWFSTHPEGTLVVYPMEATVRRRERLARHLELIREAARTSRVIDLTEYEGEGRFLEGTGSLVLDNESQIAYACLSSRTDEVLVRQWASLMDFSPVVFRAFGPDGTAVYHTNVMMCIGDGFAIVCADAIGDAAERGLVLGSLKGSGLEVIEISAEQMSRFAGNAIQLRNRSGRNLLVMSESARGCLNDGQLAAIASRSSLVSFAIPTIEACGGGSVRCMIAEIFTGPEK